MDVQREDLAAELPECPSCDTPRCLGVTVTGARLTQRMRTSSGGRPSKGPRELLGTRPSVRLAEAARARADELGMSMSDYLATLIAQDTNLVELAPKIADPTRLELPITAA